MHDVVVVGTDLSFRNDMSTPKLSPHLSKNREPAVLARIQPQLLFIPSYSSRTVLYDVKTLRSGRPRGRAPHSPPCRHQGAVSVLLVACVPCVCSQPHRLCAHACAVSASVSAKASVSATSDSSVGFGLRGSRACRGADGLDTVPLQCARSYMRLQTALTILHPGFGWAWARCRSGTRHSLPPASVIMLHAHTLPPLV